MEKETYAPQVGEKWNRRVFRKIQTGNARENRPLQDGNGIDLKEKKRRAQ